jgi:hypothetical protein
MPLAASRIASRRATKPSFASIAACIDTRSGEANPTDCSNLRTNQCTTRITGRVMRAAGQRATAAGRNKEPRRSGARTWNEIKMKMCATHSAIAAVLRQRGATISCAWVRGHRNRCWKGTVEVSRGVQWNRAPADRIAFVADWASPRPLRTPSTWPRLSVGRGLLFSPSSAAALVQPTDESGRHEHGHPESDDHAHADEHIGENKFGTVLDSHTAVSRADGLLGSPLPDART